MNKTKRYMNWTARILGGLAVIFFGIFVLGEGIPDLREIKDFLLRSMLLLIVFASVSYLLAWFRPKEGGVAMAIAGAVMGLNMFYHGGLGDYVGALIYSLPFLVPGLIFWWVGSGKAEE